MKWLLSLSSVFVTLAILELVFRLPWVEVKTGGNWPDLKKWMDHVWYNERNSLGFRDREHAAEKPEGTYRILVLGDSFVYGQMVDYDKIFPVVLEKKLNESGQKNTEVISMGLMGWNTTEQFEALKTYGLKFQPDLVIIAFVHNDPEIKDQPTSEELMDPEKPIVPLAMVDKRLNERSKLYSFIRWRYNRFLEKIGKKTDYTTWQRSLYRPEARNFKAFTSALLGIKQVSETDGAKAILAILNFNPSWDKETKLVLQTANDLGLPVIDLFPLFAGTDLKAMQVSVSDGHPNAATHAIYAQALADYIQKNIW